MVEKDAHGFGAVRFRGVEERRRAQDRAGVDARPLVEKQLHDFRLAGLRGLGERCRALAILRIDRSAAREKSARLALAAKPGGREKKRRRLERDRPP